MAVQNEFLRHADIKTTMNIYTQAVAPAKRKAIHKLTKKLLKAEVIRSGTRPIGLFRLSY